MSPPRILGMEPATTRKVQDQSDKEEHCNVSITSSQTSKETDEPYPRVATDEEIRDLRHVVGPVPPAVWLVAFTGAAQRFAYWGAIVPWQNYIQNPANNSLIPGALGLGQSRATIINNAFLLFGYLTPTLFAVISDAWFGRYKVLLIGLGEVCCVVLFVTSLPSILDSPGAGLSGLIIAFVLIGMSQGAIQTVIYPFLGDQLPDLPSQTVLTKKKEPVVTDRALTIQYMFNVYYWMVNIAGLSSFATTTLEKHIGFWAAYLLPVCFLTVAIIPLLVWNEKLIKQPPQGNILPHAAKVCFYALKAGGHISASSPSNQRIFHGRTVPWTAAFVAQIRRGLRASRVMLFFVIFYLCYNQILNNVISQAGQMRTGSVSNDTIQALNPIACIVLGPVIQKLLFPWLSRHRVPFGPIARMTTAFVFIALGMGWAAITQHLIYSRGPCYNHPLDCPAALVPETGVDGTPGVSHSQLSRQPNDISVWIQVPLHFILAVGEILGLVSVSEYAYAQAPQNMKALLQAFKGLTAALAAVLGIALGPVAKNPNLVIMYGALAGVMGITGVVFWVVFRRDDRAQDDRSPTPTDASEVEEA